MMPIFGQLWKWLLAGAVVVLVGWLWMSWRADSFPFGSSSGGTQNTEQAPPSEESVIDSLTATGMPDSQSASSSQSLTPEPSSGKSPAVGSPTVDSSILDSLSAPAR